jgi:Zn finger protein HypA/HybF involved in hydrogenase expression
MHELSIAEAILDLARKSVPRGGTLRSVRMTSGPMRGIDPQCMQLAWQAMGQRDVTLRLTLLPWQMLCADCGRLWQQPELAERCACGSTRVRPIGGDELRLVSIEVDDAEEERSPSCMYTLSKTS